jgi:hypothetical protein
MAAKPGDRPARRAHERKGVAGATPYAGFEHAAGQDRSSHLERSLPCAWRAREGAPGMDQRTSKSRVCTTWPLTMTSMVYRPVGQPLALVTMKSVTWAPAGTCFSSVWTIWPSS